MHPSVALQKSTLRRMSLDRYSSCCRISPKLSTSPDFQMRSGLDAVEELAAIKEETFITLLVATWTHIFSLFLILYPLRHCGASYQAEILGAASGAEMADINKWRIFFHSSRVNFPFGQNVCELIFGVNLTDLDLWFKLILWNNQSRATLWVRESCLIVGLRTLRIILITAFIVLKDIQHSTRTRIRCNWWNVINVCWNDVGVLDWDGVVHVWLGTLQRVSPLFLGSICPVRYGAFLCRRFPRPQHHKGSRHQLASASSPNPREWQSNPSLHCCALFPQNNIADTHLYDECTRSNAPSVCRKL